MRASEPPKPALWLLKHFGCSPNNAAIIGDLDERYRDGRSRAWYWKQACKAIAISFAQEVSGHKRRAIFAVVVGWSLLLLEGFLVLSIARSLNIEGLGIAYPNAWRTILLALFIAASCLGWVGIGWALKRLFRPFEKPMVLSFAVTVVAAVMLIAFTARSRAPLIAHPSLIGLGGNLAGLIFLLIGAGLFGESGTDRVRG